MKTLAFILLTAALYAKPCPVKGLVRNQATGAAMAGHVVRATDGEQTRTAVADREGYFVFSALPTRGFWNITSHTPGFRNAQHLSVASWDDKDGCVEHNLLLEPYGPKEQLEEERAEAAHALRCRLVVSGHVQEQHLGPLPGHVVRASNGTTVVTAVANREGFFEFLNLTPGDWMITSDMAGFKPVTPTPFATLHKDTGCVTVGLHLRRFGPREQLEEAVESLPGYAIALFQIVKEALGGR